MDPECETTDIVFDYDSSIDVKHETIITKRLTESESQNHRYGNTRLKINVDAIPLTQQPIVC